MRPPKNDVIDAPVVCVYCNRIFLHIKIIAKQERSVAGVCPACQIKKQPPVKLPY